MAANIATQKDSVEADIGRSSLKVLTKQVVLMVSGFKLPVAPRPGLRKTWPPRDGYATDWVWADWSSISHKFEFDLQPGNLLIEFDCPIS